MSDLYVRSDGDGPEISTDMFGNPTLTGGLDSAVYLSGFVGPWWANRILPAAERFISGVSVGASLNLRAARDVEEALRAALRWLIADGAATSVEVEAEIRNRDRLDILVTISEPNKERTRYRYGLNWAAQEIHTIEEGRR